MCLCVLCRCWSASESNCDELSSHRMKKVTAPEFLNAEDSSATHFLLRRCVTVGHILSLGFLRNQSCLEGISEQCRSLSHNLIITCKVPNPYSTEKLIKQNIILCLWSFRITCLIYNYLLLKSVTISLWDKKMPCLPATSFLNSLYLIQVPHTEKGSVISLIQIPTNQFGQVHLATAQIFEI